MPATTTRSYTFIFDELEEVKGVLQITKKALTLMVLTSILFL